MLLSEKATGQGAHGMENMLKERRLILASGSPRRIEMLTACGLKPQVVPSQYEETLPFPMPPEEMVMFFAMGKAMDVTRSLSEADPAGSDALPAIIIGADTTVSFEGREMGKPKDKEDGLSMLMPLSVLSRQNACASERYPYPSILAEDAPFTYSADANG